MNCGSCLCGNTTFEISGPLRPVVACHCTQCRKASGHYFAATSAHRDDVAIKGEVNWFQSSDTARRGFCPNCGSNLFWDGPGDNLSILAGALESPTGLALIGHIFCADKGDYYEITDDLPQAEGRDHALTTMVP
jgi:hypothetical protein